jgi:gas vesicle protein
MSTKSSKVLLAGITGLAAGVTIGLLFAPAKGSKTRKRLKKKIMNLADIIEDDFSDKVGAIKTAFSGKEDNDEGATGKTRSDDDED